jgi:2-dehydropantoate 2-reductase
MGMTATNIAVSAPGTVTMQRNDATVIGPSCADCPSTEVGAAADLLRKSRLKIVTDANVVGAQYNKLVFNTLGAASSLSASDFLGEAVLHREWRNTVAIPLQRESLNVLAQSGVRLSRIPGAPDAFRFQRLLRLLNWPMLGRLTEFVIRAFFNRKPIRFSLGIDLARGRKTEVDFINGEIVRLATANQVSAPLNTKVVELVHQLEQRGGFLSRGEVMDLFRRVTP